MLQRVGRASGGVVVRVSAGLTCAGDEGERVGAATFPYDP